MAADQAGPVAWIDEAGRRRSVRVVLASSAALWIAVAACLLVARPDVPFLPFVTFTGGFVVVAAVAFLGRPHVAALSLPLPLHEAEQAVANTARRTGGRRLRMRDGAAGHEVRWIANLGALEPYWVRARLTADEDRTAIELQLRSTIVLGPAARWPKRWVEQFAEELRTAIASGAS